MQTLKKLLLLIIAMGLLIGIFSRPEHQHDNKTPWNIQRLPDGHIHVFGITPGKTTVQEANQILGHFAATRLHNTEPAQLIATHENMMLGEEMAQLDLQYQIDETELAYMQQSSTVFSPCQPVQLTTEDEIALLNTPIAKIIYTPVTDYSTNKVEHHFDEADEIRQINETQQIMFYREIGLTVYINSDKPDVFVYESR